MVDNPLMDAKASAHLTFRQIDEEKKRAEAHLIGRRELRQNLSMLDSAYLLFPEAPGVYCIFDGDVLVYVGETGDLRGRMRDLKETRNHTFRRNLGTKLFKDRDDFAPASASTCFPSALEVELSQYMGKQISVCGMVVHFGRKEIEEYLIATHRPTFCTKGRRGQKRRRVRRES